MVAFMELSIFCFWFVGVLGEKYGFISAEDGASNSKKRP